MNATTTAIVYVLASILVILVLMQLGLMGWLFSGIIMAALGFYIGVVGKSGLKEMVFLAGSSLGIFLIFEALLGFAKPYGLPAGITPMASLDVTGAFLYFIGALIAVIFLPYVKK
jgi:hypothetical protein